MRNLVVKFWKAQLNKEQLLGLHDRLEKESQVLEQELRTEYEQMLTTKVTTTKIERARAEMILKNLHHKMAVAVQMPAVFERRNFQMLKWAASIAVVLSISVAIFYSNKKADHQKDESVALTTTKNNYSNTAKHILNISLPDGSIVMLYPKSSFDHNPDYGNRYRNINLKGKAEFIVQKDKEHPFTVSANNVHTIALGTIFTVDAWEQNLVNVLLKSGKVVVRSQDLKGNNLKDTYLLPGEGLTVNRSSGIITKRKNAMGLVKPIKTGYPSDATMAFNQTSLTNVFSTLSKNYNKQIEFDAKEIDSMLFTGTFKRSEDLLNILSVVCEMNNLTFMENKSKITIQKK
ncbi:FecR family protein [Pedobacter xixiisoli]|uniref:FecR family protein n=1 Tax=Pedobacter xixiisoli TaxID=1476464 RepID=A0A286ACX2_9SPHI|nr:FecR family protein [Pedobacter xixiisoli]SOD19760.1 FecR family protein [Pedobacter xixiisoli]